MKQDKKPRNNPTYLCSISLCNKRSKESIEKDNAFNKGAGTTGQLHAKK